MADTTFATRTGVRVGVALWQELTLARLAELAKQAEDDGYDTLVRQPQALPRSVRRAQRDGDAHGADRHRLVHRRAVLPAPGPDRRGRSPRSTSCQAVARRSASGPAASRSVTIGVQRRRPVGFMSEADGDRPAAAGRRALRLRGRAFPAPQRRARSSRSTQPRPGRARGARRSDAQGGGPRGPCRMVAPFATAAGLGHARELIERGDRGVRRSSLPTSRSWRALTWRSTTNSKRRWTRCGR